MPLQSEAALENGLIATLQKMNYEYVHLEEEKNLNANFKRQLEKHNHKQLAEFGRTQFTDNEFERILIHLEGGTRFEKAKKLRDLYPLDLDSGERLWVEFLDRRIGARTNFKSPIRSLLRAERNAVMTSRFSSTVCPWCRSS